jgi:hypothetical protein
MRLGVSVRRRTFESIGIAVAAGCAVFCASFARPSWDVSEARVNSFSESDERALAGIHAPLSIEVHLAQEDPRRVDLETRALAKLRRLMRVQVTYVAATSIGLFEQANPGYGEIRYELGGRRTMSRATTAEGVLESVYSVSDVKAPVESDDGIFRGHPLAVAPTGAGALFYAAWPLVSLGAGFVITRRLR